MAGIYFEQLYKAVDELEAAFWKAKMLSDEEYRHGSSTQGQVENARARGIFDSMLIYYQTTLQHGKFKAQKAHCKAALTRMNPPFAEVYFKGKK